MDYMVFLTSRIREEHVHGLKTRPAVEHGIAAIGRVVVAAAIIMATVSAFILTPERVSKEFGLLLAVAILTDALVVNDAHTCLHDADRRKDLVHPALAGQAPAEHHDRAPARRRAAGLRPEAPGGRAVRLAAGARQLERFSQLVQVVCAAEGLEHLVRDDVAACRLEVDAVGRPHLDLSATRASGTRHSRRPGPPAGTCR